MCCKHRAIWFLPEKNGKWTQGLCFMDSMMTSYPSADWKMSGPKEKKDGAGAPVLVLVSSSLHKDTGRTLEGLSAKSRRDLL